MPFQKTLIDWAKFDITKRTKFDAAISSGLAIMANQKHLYTPSKQKSKISINFARYNNKNSLESNNKIMDNVTIDIKSASFPDQFAT